jgi:alginate O-acetyltransferase complex protein AlgI
MLFNSLEFALFLGVVVTTYRVLSLHRQNLFLLGASYLFYGFWDPRFLSLILLSTVIDFFCGSRIHASTRLEVRRRFLAVSLAANLGILGVFKYFNFFADSLQSSLATMGFEADRVTLDIVLPVGISFYTFQTLSYTIDIYRRQLEPERRFTNFALFVAFFPQLVAGPIERARTLLPQIRESRTIDAHDLTMGLWLILWGLYLKVVVADNLAPIADAAFDSAATADGVTTLLGSYAFALQIFGDFAGYSWIAIGVARMLGFRLMTNFRFPYAVTRPREFWHHWHISLSTWLRDYLYIPLGGSRGSRYHLYRNLMLTMLLGGLWHGAAWNFVIWGLFHGTILALDHWLTARVPSFGRAIPQTVRWLMGAALMFQVTCIGWLIFRAPSFDRLWSMLNSLFVAMQWPTREQLTDAMRIGLFGALVIGMHILQAPALRRWEFKHLPPVARGAIALVLVYSIVVFGRFGATPFIYFQF